MTKYYYELYETKSYYSLDDFDFVIRRSTFDKPLNHIKENMREDEFISADWIYFDNYKSGITKNHVVVRDLKDNDMDNIICFKCTIYTNRWSDTFFGGNTTLHPVRSYKIIRFDVDSDKKINPDIYPTYADIHGESEEDE
jgi:hypothetical protein